MYMYNMLLCIEEVKSNAGAKKDWFGIGEFFIGYVNPSPAGQTLA